MATGLIGLASQHASRPERSGRRATSAFSMARGRRPRRPATGSGWWKHLPHDIVVGQVREAPEILGELSAELARRQQEGQDGLPPIYLLIYNLGRFRDLRKEDDFSFGREDDKPATPGKMFATILRDGPACGIHTIAWCDSYATVNRLLDRQSLRDFDLRVLVPDERHRQQQPDGLARCGPAGRASGHLLRWRSRPDGEVPALRAAFRPVAGRGAAAVVPPHRTVTAFGSALIVTLQKKYLPGVSLLGTIDGRLGEGPCDWTGSFAATG